MREDITIKACWALYRSAILAELPALGVSDAKSFYQKARGIYRSELAKLPEYGAHDVLKLNLAHAVMLGAIYACCDPKPDIDTLTGFYRDFMLRPKIVRWAFSNVRMLSPSNVKRQVKIGEKSQGATHPFTWQFKVEVEDQHRFTANFTRCGIYDYLSSRGMAHIVPALCALDYTFGEIGKHWFLRESTLATGGSLCDCHYVDKSAATEEEAAKSICDQKDEAIRGGRTWVEKEL